MALRVQTGKPAATPSTAATPIAVSEPASAGLSDMTKTIPRASAVRSRSENRSAGSRSRPPSSAEMGPSAVVTSRPIAPARRPVRTVKTAGAPTNRSEASSFVHSRLDRFSIDAVARRAGVARMTVYHQFGSRRGLLEALFDAFAAGGELPGRLAAAFQQPAPLDALADFVAAFARFWEAGRPWVRRVRALAVLDPELGAAVEARNARRRQGVGVLVERLARRYGPAAPEDRARAEDMLYTLTSFETFDTLAGPKGRFEDVAVHPTDCLAFIPPSDFRGHCRAANCRGRPRPTCLRRSV